MELSLECLRYPETLLRRKPIFSFLAGTSCKWILGLDMTLCVSLSSSQCRSYVCSHNFCEFINVLVLLWKKDTVSLAHPPTSGSSNISTSSWHVSLSPESKDWIETFCQSLSTSGIVQFWVSVITTIYCNKILPWWVLSKALDHGYTSMSFRSHVITMFL